MNDLKPLIRWNIGPAHIEGFNALHMSIKHMKNLYGSTCKYAICHNGLAKDQIFSLPKVDLIVDRMDHIKDLIALPPSYNKGKPAWKLYPPRLDLETHEIILDNDIILYRKPELFETFLNQKTLIITSESIKRSYNGPFNSLIPNGFNINSGILGFPPFFDFKSKLNEKIHSHWKWESHFDEQTLVAYILFNNKESLKIIPLSEVYVCFDNYKLGNSGVHFVGLNGGKTNYWWKFIQNRIKML